VGDQTPEVNVDLESQIRFVEFMLQGYKEPTGQRMLSAIKGSLEKLKGLKENL
jgi:hypothetical protein